MELENTVSDEKNALLALKEKILKEIQFYEQSIEDVQKKPNTAVYVDSSSDSDDDYTKTVDLVAPSVMQLKTMKSELKTSLKATEELTSLQILESEVNILVNRPSLVGKKLINEEGEWKEVIAECRIDLVPFSITFFTHTPNRKFAPTWYRDVKVTVVKTSQDGELSSSILNSVKTPSDAVAVLKSYSEAYRSRRSSLARLAELYIDSLFMEPMRDGGYFLKCDNVLEMSWRLENKWSPLSPFHHKMNFELEYIEEKYVTKITELHKKLSDPTLSTDERTQLLSDIISVCLEAKRNMSDVAETETGLQNGSERKGREDGVMAPPKNAPQRSKLKSNQGNRSSQRIEVSSNTNHENDNEDRTNVEGNESKESANINSNNSKAIVDNRKRNRPIDNKKALENVKDPKRLKTTENDLLNNIESESNKLGNVDKKIDNGKGIKQGGVAVLKNKVTTGKITKNVIDDTNKDKEGKRSDVANESKVNKDAIHKGNADVAMLKNKTAKDKMKNVNGNSNRKERVISSGRKVKKIDSPKNFNMKRPQIALKILNNRKFVSKKYDNTGKENIGKVSKIPQMKSTVLPVEKLNTQKKPTAKSVSSSNKKIMEKKMSNIPRLAKPTTRNS